MNIGITGGSTLCILGERAEVVAFFDRARAASSQVSGQAALVSDRLYRRYLRPTELASASHVLSEMVSLLSLTASPREAEFHEKLLRGFEQCAESATLNFEAFKDAGGYTYEPVRIVVSDLPWFTFEKQRALEEYEDHLAEPLWLHAG